MKKRHLRALSFIMSAILLVGCTTTPTVGTGTQEAAQASETGMPEAAEDGSAGGETKETEAAASQQEFPPLKVAKDRPLKVGYLYSNLEAESCTRSYNQIRIEAPHRGWELTEVYFNAQKPEEARTGMQTLITQDVDAVVIYNMEIVGIADLILQARQNGIGVYNVDNQLVPGVVANSCQPNGVAAAEFAYYMGEKYLWNANYAIITAPSLQVHVERTDPIKAIYDQYPGMKLLGEESLNPSGSESMGQQSYNFSKRFIEKYGNELDILVTSYDGAAVTADEAAAQAIGGTDVAIIGVDGGSETWSHMRKGGNFKYSYAQPTELYCHKICNLVEELQVQGLKPGDEGCSITAFGETIYSNGKIIDQDHVPAPNQSIHSVFDFYGGDPEDPEAWYNWNDGPGIYMIADK